MAAGAGTITTADLGALNWPVDGRLLYQFGTGVGPNNTRIPWHGIGIAAPVGTPVRAVAGGTGRERLESSARPERSRRVW